MKLGTELTTQTTVQSANRRKTVVTSAMVRVGRVAACRGGSTPPSVIGPRGR